MNHNGQADLVAMCVRSALRDETIVAGGDDVDGLRALYALNLMALLLILELADDAAMVNTDTSVILLRTQLPVQCGDALNFSFHADGAALRRRSSLK